MVFTIPLSSIKTPSVTAYAVPAPSERAVAIGDWRSYSPSTYGM